MDAVLAVDLQRVKGDRRAKFVAAMQAEVCFDYFGLERGGHYAVLQWLLKCGPQPGMCVMQAGTDRPGALFYHPNGWFTSAIAPPRSVALTYGPDRDLSTEPSRINHGKVIVCVRDVRNMLASRRRWNTNHSRVLFRVDTWGVAAWKQHAKQVLGDEDYFGGHAYGMSYDKWFVSLEYRERVVRELNAKFGWELTYDAESVNSVPTLAEGSSFDGNVYDGKAQKMKVLDRWREFEDDPVINKILTKDVLELNGRLIDGIS